MDQIVLNAFLYLDAKMENVSIIQIPVFVIQDGVATSAMNLIARKIQNGNGLNYFQKE